MDSSALCGEIGHMVTTLSVSSQFILQFFLDKLLKITKNSKSGVNWLSVSMYGVKTLHRFHFQANGRPLNRSLLNSPSRH